MVKQNRGAILVISGPSGCGKSSLLKEVYKEVNDFYFSISTTTREPRAGEKDGVDYYFVSKEQFEQDIKENKFLEYANVHGNYYGTPIQPMQNALDEEKLVIFDIDVQGHSIIQEKINEFITSVFITTPSLSELEKRLINRATDTKETIKKRLVNAQEEIKSIFKYDYFIVNDDFQKASKELTAIAMATRIKSKLMKKDILENWNK